VLGGAAGGTGLRFSAEAALRGGAEPVDAAICAAEKARRTARARSVAALFIITFRLSCARITVVVEGSSEGAGGSPGASLRQEDCLWFAPDERLKSEQN